MSVTPQPGGRYRGAAAPNPVIVDRVFRALSDPTRRNVMERLALKPASTSELASLYDMALASFVGHLKVLEGSGLVRSRKVGRTRTYELAPEQMMLAETWLGQQRKIWERRLDQLDDYLLKMKQESSK